jgi:hypothetical protein
VSAVGYWNSPKACSVATSSKPWPLAPGDLTDVGDGPWFRITAKKFADPLGYGQGMSRFVPPKATWAGIYLADNIVTCFREAVLRDRALNPEQSPIIEEEDLALNLCVEAAIPTNFKVVDLIHGALVPLIDTDARGRRNSKAPGTWAEHWRSDPLKPQGILFPSRFTGEPCLFVYDRAVPLLHARWTSLLSRLPSPHAETFQSFVGRVLSRSGL